MEIFENTYKSDGDAGCVLALGNFDGIHNGHRFLLEKARDYARENGLKFGVYTFNDSPKFRHCEHSLLTDVSHRISYIDEYVSPDFIYLEAFDSVCGFSPEEFVSYISEKFNAVCTFCGENFTFGKGACGNAQSLVQLMSAINLTAVVVPYVMDGNRVVSSTFIKELLHDGDVEKAASLGYRYGFTTKVVHGKRLGRKLGFPTVNQVVPNELVVLKYGVYSTVVFVEGKQYFGVTNFGVKPTVNDEDKRPVAETYIIDFDGDVYGKYVGLYFYKMLREEKKFSSLEQLSENIKMNVDETVSYFKEYYEN